MHLNFKIKSKPVNHYHYLISPSQQRLSKKGFYGSLSLLFALTMGLGAPVHAENPYGVIEWDKPNYKVDESAGKVYLVANRLEGSNGEVKVRYGTRSQTAKAGMNADYDYQAASGELTWGPGDKTSRLVEINIFDDDEDEEDEYFQVVLLDPIGNPMTGEGTLGKITKVTIQDNDAPPPTAAPPTQEKLVAFMPILVKASLTSVIKFRFGMPTVFRTKSANFAEARGFDGGMVNFDEASQAFLVGLQNGLAQLNLPELQVSVTEAGAILTVPIYNAQGDLEGEYHAMAGEPVATSETEAGIFTTDSGLAYLIYQNDDGNYLRANLYATLAPEILTALQANFPDAQITQEEEVVTLKLDKYESYRFIANHFVNSGGLDTDPLTTQLIDADNDGMANYAVLSAAGKEQFVYSVD
jgi:hypothetical protein